MSYVKTINEDGVVSDIMAKALDPDVLVNGFTQTTAGVNALDAAAGKTLNDSLSTLDGAVVKKANLVNGFTQTTPGVNALDAAAGKSLNDSLATTDASIANLKNGTDTFSGVSLDIPNSSNKVAVQVSANGLVNVYGGASNNIENMQVHTYLQDRYGAISSRYRTRESASAAWGEWSSYGYMYPMRHKDISDTTDENGFVSLNLDPDTTLPVLGSTRKGGGSLSDRYVEFTPGTSSWYGRVTYRGSAVASTAIKFRVWYFDAKQNLV